MKSTKTTHSLLLAAALMSSSLPAMAGWQPTKGEMSSIITVVVLSAPLILSSGLVASTHAKISDGSQKRERERAGKLPPMKVERIEDREDGTREVELVPEDAAIEGNALLQWPANHPDTPFTVGQVVDFNPSEAGTGWIITARDGTELAFVPTTEAARHSSTGQW